MVKHFLVCEIRVGEHELGHFDIISDDVDGVLLGLHNCNKLLTLLCLHVKCCQHCELPLQVRVLLEITQLESLVLSVEYLTVLEKVECFFLVQAF